MTIPYGRHVIDEDDVAAVVAVLRSDYLTTGPAGPAFETAFAARVQASYAVAVNSGTSALLALLRAADVEGGEVVTSPLTFVATANAIAAAGATPRFADVLPEERTLAPEAVASAITGRTRAVLAVDYAGAPSRYAEMRRVCRAAGVPLLVDAAHSLGGAAADGRPVGADGVADGWAFSLHPLKAITAGEGGVVTTSSGEWAARARAFRCHGVVGSTRHPDGYRVPRWGLNLKLSELGAALARSQLAKLDRFVARHAEIAARYASALEGWGGGYLPSMTPGHAWHLYAVEVRESRDDVMRRLRARGIEAQVHYPLAVDLGSHRADGPLPVARELTERLLSLPCWPGLADAQVDECAAALREVCP